MWRIRIRFRAALPVLFGLLGLTLALWSFARGRVFHANSVPWDLGPPIWSSEAARLFFREVNAPATLLTSGIPRILKLRDDDMYYFACLPAIVFWWWGIGKWIDSGVVRHRRFRHARVVRTFLRILGVVLLGFAALRGYIEVSRVFEIMRERFGIRDLIFVSSPGYVLWLVVLGIGCFIAAKPVLNFEDSSFNEITFTLPRRIRVLLTAFAILPIYFLTLSRWDRSHATRQSLDQTEYDREMGYGEVRGIILDEDRRPIVGIEVDLIPTFKFGDARWYATHTDWTDEVGRFSLNQLEPGEYKLGANSFDRSSGPDEGHPYATLYYPKAQSEVDAGPISVSRLTSLTVDPMQLRKLEIATVKINVFWQGGMRPKRSNIVFKNEAYAMTGMAPQIDNGVGEIHVPKGFAYSAIASVQCDGGAKIVTYESRPAMKFEVRDGLTPDRLTFIIPATPCRLWTPD